MSIDQFFGFGPEVSFVAHEVFTNREEQIERLHRWLVQRTERAWPASDLQNFHRAAENIQVVVGAGGIGKSTLARHVADLALAGRL
ncbi:hypothetical protein ACFQ07_24855, partial [Actinomadura adrarensis]